MKLLSKNIPPKNKELLIVIQWQVISNGVAIEKGYSEGQTFAIVEYINKKKGFLVIHDDGEFTQMSKGNIFIPFKYDYTAIQVDDKHVKVKCVVTHWKPIKAPKTIKLKND